MYRNRDSRLKLAYISSSIIPSREANSIHVMKMCQAMARMGHEVTLVAPDVRKGIEPGISDLYTFYGVDASFAVRKVPWRPIRGQFWIYGLESARLVRSLGVDGAFGRSLHGCAMAVWMGVPTKLETHGPDFLNKPQTNRCFRWMLKASAFRGLVVHCEALKQHIVKLVPESADKIMVAHCAGDALPDELEPADLGCSGKRLQVGYVGQLFPGKGIEIIRPLAEKAPWADFHIVGGERDIVDSLRKDSLLPGNIRLHGFVPPSDTAKLSLAFDVLLAPYQPQVITAGGGETAEWMSPLKLFDYMATGKPILCSDLPVLREIIQNNRNGLMLPDNDSGAWAKALERLSIDPAERNRLGSTAREDFLARFTWDARARRVLNGLV